MTTIINNPDQGEPTSGSSVSLILIILVLLIGGVLLYSYGLPNRSGGNEGVNVSIPDKVDVNVKTPDTSGGGTDAGGGAAPGGY